MFDAFNVSIALLHFSYFHFLNSILIYRKLLCYLSVLLYIAITIEAKHLAF